MRVLVADDNADGRLLLKYLLTGWGHEAVCTEDGQEAWQILTGPQAPELAILDWVMPGLDGVQLCRRVREAERHQGHYLILLTSRHGPQDLVQALESGADDYITKPFDCEELRARVRVGCRMLELQARLREQERREGVLQMAAAVCHELNQSLQIVMSSTELLLEAGAATDPNYELWTTLQHGVERMAEVTHRVMSTTHASSREYLDPQHRMIELGHASASPPSSFRTPKNTPLQ